MADLFRPHLNTYLAQLTDEYAHLQAALQWAKQQKNYAIGLRLAGALAQFWYQKGYLGEGRQWLEDFLSMAANSDDIVPPVAAKARIALGLLLWAQGHFRDAEEHYQHGISLYHQLEDQEGMTLATYHLGRLFRDRGELEKAEKLYTQCLDHWQSSPNQSSWWLAATECSLGDIWQDRGWLEKAEHSYRNSHDRWIALNDKWGRARALDGLWGVARWRSQYEEAIKLCEQSQGFYMELGDLRGVALSFSSLGKLYRERQDYKNEADLALASAHYNQSLALLEELGADEDIGFLRLLIGELELTQKHYDDARDLYETSLKQFQELNSKAGIAEAYFHLGALAREERSLLEAGMYYKASLELFYELGKTTSTSGCLERIGGIACDLGAFDVAGHLYGQADHLLRRLVGIEYLPVDRKRYKRVTKRLQQSLGDDYGIIHAHGEKLTLSEAIAIANTFVDSMSGV